ALPTDGRQRGELEDSERRPAQAREVRGPVTTSHDTLHGGRTAQGMTPLRRGDDQRTTLSDRLAQKVIEGGADARVGDAPRRQQELHDCLQGSRGEGGCI